jgi:hypothetical protein
MHASLTPKNNIRLIAVFAVTLVLLIAFASVPPVLYAIGAIFGIAGGLLQLCAIRRARAAFVAAPDALAVRSALASSPCGKIYLVLFWLGAAAFFGISFYLLRERFFFGWAASYSSFVVLRDLLALRATYELQTYASRSEIPQAI